ncbi:hypothetical protein FXF50_00380 [Micromonospora sp. AP08]|uniref:hypothetical protein n=1 Tax=Micromonospora sp. AP08 TaxID=2604467 RepID=UPI0011D378AB|nr:hypothetical protein [Micromonospora sp. AP08]TYB40236.1 hypothetical protein FXF50_00380 [Micromonospora sp. AP08]
MLLTRIDRHLPPALTSLRWASPALSLLGVVLVLWAWIEIPRADTIGAGGWSTISGGHIGDIVRDRLQVLHLDGLRYDVGWGRYAGIFAMSSLSALLLLQASHTHRHAT